MAKNVDLLAQKKATQKKLKEINQKLKNKNNEELVSFANAIKKCFEKYPKFTLKNFENWTRQNTSAVAKALSIDVAPTPQAKPTTPTPQQHH